jgi:iron-sulfur cluster assembly accessory protein
MNEVAHAAIDKTRIRLTTDADDDGSMTDAVLAMTQPVLLTDRAARRISEIVAREPSGSLLRVSVKGGGCSGFQYSFDIVQSREDGDIVLEKNGATVLIDEMSLPFMAGSEIDFVDDLMGAAFKVSNPNASASCGCGVSFSV